MLFSSNGTPSAEERQRISADTTILIESLNTFTFYFITVQAYNVAGEGPRSDVIVAQTSEGGMQMVFVIVFSKFVTLTMEWLGISFNYVAFGAMIYALICGIWSHDLHINMWHMRL